MQKGAKDRLQEHLAAQGHFRIMQHTNMGFSFQNAFILKFTTYNL